MKTRKASRERQGARVTMAGPEIQKAMADLTWPSSSWPRTHSPPPKKILGKSTMTGGCSGGAGSGGCLEGAGSGGLSGGAGFGGLSGGACSGEVGSGGHSGGAGSGGGPGGVGT